MHEFEMLTAFGETTLMYCKQCALTFSLMSYRDDNGNFHNAWEPVSFSDLDGNEKKPYWKHCGQEDEKKKVRAKAEPDNLKNTMQ